MSRKLRVGVIFGGRSGEHAVSVASAASILDALDQSRYEIVPIGINHDGSWLAGPDPRRMLAGAVMSDAASAGGSTVPVRMTGDPTQHGLVTSGGEADASMAGPLDIVIPVLHGTYGEDGTLQGLLEMAGVAYTGCGVLGSALGMDKEKAKQIFRSAGLPVVDWITLRRRDWERNPADAVSAIEGQFNYPVFAKPANMGSSVGVGKAHDQAELGAVLDAAFAYDGKVIIEPSINCRELECGVLGNEDPVASVVGEVIPSNEFYDYRAKYIDNASRLFIPAQVPDSVSQRVRDAAIQAFAALELSGLARVDFFLDKDTSDLYVNEVNTMPGFTEISMYPKLWEATGIPYSELLDRLIALGLERHAERARNRTTFDPEAQ